MKNATQKRRLRGIFLAFMTIMLLSLTVLSVKILAVNDVDGTQAVQTLAEGETINGPGFFAGNLVLIAGTVEGTTFAAGQEVRITGNINGDLFVASQNITIDGVVTGNIYVAGQGIKIGVQSEGDVFAAGQNVTIAKEAIIGRDLFAAGATILQEGTIQRSLFGGGSEIIIAGLVGGDVNLQTENLKLQDNAVIEGKLSYESANEADIASGSKITGETDWKKVASMSSERTRIETKRPMNLFFGFLWSVTSALLVWFLVKVWRPDFWTKTALPIAEVPLKTLGVGFLALVVTPLLILLAMVTIIGIPLGMLVGLAYWVSMYLSKIVVAVFIGQWLAKQFKWPELHKGVWLVMLGLVILGLLNMLPFVKFIVGLLTVAAGLGSFILAHYKVPADNRPANPIP